MNKVNYIFVTGVLLICIAFVLLALYQFWFIGKINKFAFVAVDMFLYYIGFMLVYLSYGSLHDGYLKLKNKK